MSEVQGEQDEIFNRLSKVVSETFRVPPSVRITPQTSSADIEGWDSLSHTMLIMNVEDAFAIDLPLEEILELENLGALADVIRKVPQSRN